MNYVYRLLWNGKIGFWIAVSEHANSSGKKSLTKISVSLCALIIGGGMFLNANAYSVVGADIFAETNNKIGVGINAKACSTNSFAVGTASIASGEQSISIGSLSKATEESAIALGWSAETSGGTSISIGNGASASVERSFALDNSAEARGINSLALGPVVADKDKSIAIGVGSGTYTNATQQSSVKLNGLTYGEFAGQINEVGMQVSIGDEGAERQIKNVGSGEISNTSTDAINGSQLYATNAVLGNISNSIEIALGGNATLNPDSSSTMTDIGETSQNTIHSAILASQEAISGGTNVANVTTTTGANGQLIYTVNTDGASVSAGSSGLNVVAGAKDANNVTGNAVDLSQGKKDSLVKANTALRSVVTQIDGIDVKTVDQNENKVNFVTSDNLELTLNTDGVVIGGGPSLTKEGVVLVVKINRYC